MWRVLALLASLFTFVEGITWSVSGAVFWGQACDWSGGDIGSVGSAASGCGGACVANSNCDHFTWSNYNGGTCWLKHFGSNQQTALSATQSDVCGWVGSRVFSWQVSGSVTWANGCDWSSGDIGNVQVGASGCGPACQNHGGCDHFTWTSFNTGTCWLKQFGTSDPNNPPPVYGPSGGLCGYLNGGAPPPSNIQGFYWWTWDTPTPPAGTNAGIAFSGLVDPYAALSNSNGTLWNLPGTRYISLGGGNGNGYWSASVLGTITSAINGNSFSNYQGIVFDVEEGDAGLSNSFGSAFQAAKSKGLKVLVTVSHSAPYGISDAYNLMMYFFQNTNIDYISPQLYTSGTESSNDYTTSGGVSWSQYGSSHALVAPSIVHGYLYNDAQNNFQNNGVTLHGYVQWAQS